MTEPTPFALSQLFSNLIDRDVKFVRLPGAPPPGKAQILYGTYTQLPAEHTIVVKAEIPALASLAGALLGLPPDDAIERALEKPMDESLRDAIHEVLNIASTALSMDGRVVFNTMTTNRKELTLNAEFAVDGPSTKPTYKVSIDGDAYGTFSVLSRS